MENDSFNNPLSSEFGSIPDLIFAIINVLIIIALPIVVFFLIFAGFMYVTARGNPEKLQKASQALLYGVIGGVIILASAAIMTIVKNIVVAF